MTFFLHTVTAPLAEAENGRLALNPEDCEAVVRADALEYVSSGYIGAINSADVMELAMNTLTGFERLFVSRDAALNWVRGVDTDDYRIAMYIATNLDDFVEMYADVEIRRDAGDYVEMYVPSESGVIDELSDSLAVMAGTYYHA